MLQGAPLMARESQLLVVPLRTKGLEDPADEFRLSECSAH